MVGQLVSTKDMIPVISLMLSKKVLSKKAIAAEPVIGVACTHK